MGPRSSRHMSEGWHEQGGQAGPRGHAPQVSASFPSLSSAQPVLPGLDKSIALYSSRALGAWLESALSWRPCPVCPHKSLQSYPPLIRELKVCKRRPKMFFPKPWPKLSSKCS